LFASRKNQTTKQKPPREKYRSGVSIHSPSKGWRKVVLPEQVSLNLLTKIKCSECHFSIEIVCFFSFEIDSMSMVTKHWSSISRADIPSCGLYQWIYIVNSVTDGEQMIYFAYQLFVSDLLAHHISLNLGVLINSIVW
jgi:hypothetical protein